MHPAPRTQHDHSPEGRNATAKQPSTHPKAQSLPTQDPRTTTKHPVRALKSRGDTPQPDQPTHPVNPFFPVPHPSNNQSPDPSGNRNTIIRMHSMHTGQSRTPARSRPAPDASNRPHPPHAARETTDPHPRLHRDPHRTFTTGPKPTTSIPPRQPPLPCPPPAPSPQPGPTHRTHREAAKHRAPPHPHSARVKITTRAPIPTTAQHPSRVATHPAAAARQIQAPPPANPHCHARLPPPPPNPDPHTGPTERQPSTERHHIRTARESKSPPAHRYQQPRNTQAEWLPTPQQRHAKYRANTAPRQHHAINQQ
ncbi:extensin-like [Micropterus dolomieu]|uniref:extensin-like n=1 Tax=Micropterus dolomieu TaxID=147949 RepID=UPI001E8D3C35|nr:extensin-like [Micropterus dolomieu]